MEAASPTEVSVSITNGCDLTFQKAGMSSSTAVKMSYLASFSKHKSHIFFKDVTHVRMCCPSPIYSVMWLNN